VHASTRVSAQERDAMIALALRRDQLPLPVRHALFAKLARHLEAQLALTRPAYISDERFVLNLATIVLGQPRAANALGVASRKAGTR
jgi:hypothetical protein